VAPCVDVAMCLQDRPRMFLQDFCCQRQEACPSWRCCIEDCGWSSHNTVLLEELGRDVLTTTTTTSTGRFGAPVDICRKPFAIVGQNIAVYIRVSRCDHECRLFRMPYNTVSSWSSVRTWHRLAPSRMDGPEADSNVIITKRQLPVRDSAA
jgi:hypothetical protein